MNEKHLSILQHALGTDQFGRRQRGSDRNYFVTGDGCEDYRLCIELVALDLMVKCAGNALTGGDDVFYVKRAGMAYVAEHSEKPPKLTRSQKRYLEWLDADSSWTFGEWIKHGFGRAT